tara:strand:+ start:31 stop:387 length:357 start_codon:yes stop_codon:yes gene_type:complete
MIEILIVILLIFGISCLGIFLTRKFKAIKNYTSKTSTILFLVFLSIFVFFWNFAENGNVAHSIGFVAGYVYLFTVPCAFFATVIMNKFKNNKKEFWHSWFFSLIPIFIVLISQSILEI